MSAPSVQMIETRFGPMLGLRGDLYMTRSLEKYGEYCPGERRLLEQLVKPGMTVVEVGANIGSHSVALARACAPGTFYAFEPQPRVFQILCANLALNDVANALAYPEACGEAEGVATIPPLDYAAEGNFGGVELQPAETPGVKVRVAPLDALKLPSLGLLKVDVEGFEPQVIRGARATLQRCRPAIYIENDRSAHQGELIRLIADLGYRLYWHTPYLYEPDNFRGDPENVFGRVLSVNMLCLPNERRTVVQGMTEIDPDNWTSPIKVSR